MEGGAVLGVRPLARSSAWEDVPKQSLRELEIHASIAQSFIVVKSPFIPHASEYELCTFSLSFFSLTPSTSSKL